MDTRRLLAVPLLVLFLLPAPAFAWGRLGHWLVGQLASQQLTPEARAQVELLLAGEADPSLGGVASWADDLRNTDPERFKTTSRWHYINAKGGGCGFDLPRDCPDGDCVVAAIEAQRKVLADKTQPLEARRDALKFVIHFVGDAHQPMHAGNRVDSGGNRFQVSLRTDIEPEAYARNSYKNGVMGTNLHSVWDYYILAAARLPQRQYADRLATRLPPLDAAQLGTPLAWARQSCEIIDAHALYPADDHHVMDHAYLDAMRPLAELRIAAAAVRLADLLNGALK